MKRIFYVAAGLAGLCFVYACQVEKAKSDYRIKHESMAKIIADEHGWIYGENGKYMTLEQYDYCYNQAIDDLTELGIEEPENW